jgi:hypothetical protein
MASIEPLPRHSSNSPSIPSSSDARVFAKGTMAAQAAAPKPGMKNSMRVERRSREPMFDRMGSIRQGGGLTPFGAVDAHRLRRKSRAQGRIGVMFDDQVVDLLDGGDVVS